MKNTWTKNTTLTHPNSFNRGATCKVRLMYSLGFDISGIILGRQIGCRVRRQVRVLLPLLLYECRRSTLNTAAWKSGRRTVICVICVTIGFVGAADPYLIVIDVVVVVVENKIRSLSSAELGPSTALQQQPCGVTGPSANRGNPPCAMC